MFGQLDTGGGFTAQEDLLIYSSTGPHAGDEWRVYIKNTHTSENRTVNGYANCLSLPDTPYLDEFQYLPVVLSEPLP